MLKHKKMISLAMLLIALVFAFTLAQPAVIFADAPASNAVPQTTPVPSASPEEAIQSGPPLSLTLTLLCFCLAFGLLIGVFVLGVIVRMPGRKDKDIEKVKEEHGL